MTQPVDELLDHYDYFSGTTEEQLEKQCAEMVRSFRREHELRVELAKARNKLAKITAAATRFDQGAMAYECSLAASARDTYSRQEVITMLGRIGNYGVSGVPGPVIARYLAGRS